MSGASSNALPLGAATYFIHHVFLPPKLPQGGDFNLEHETSLLDITIDSLSRFKAYNANNHRAIVGSAIGTISNLRALRLSANWGGGDINEEKLRVALVDLCKDGGMIPLHLRAQNCGVMISKVGGSIHVEVFELSPLNEAVVSTKGRLQRTFPGCAVSVDLAIFEQPSFLATTAQTLAKMSHQSAVETQPKARKAGRMHDEDRDTTHPNMVTEFFMGFLRSVGQPVQVSCLSKNTREEVMYHASRFPWRRSPLWLLVRVTLQLAFSRSTVKSESESTNDKLYKMFMVFLTSRILDLSLQHAISSDLLYAMNAKIARRLLKLESSIDEFVPNSVQNIVRKASDRLQTRWLNIMALDGISCDLASLEKLDFDHDISNSLPALDNYIKLMAQRNQDKTSRAFQPKADLVKYQAEELPNCLDSQIKEYKPYNLMAVEGWVASNLGRWLEAHQKDPNTCGKLADLIRKYHGIAYPFYSGSAEATSTMVLTILELWIACDESATRICEFLKDYDPDIPRGLLESLVLPFKSQMERLSRAEEYLDRRRARATATAPRIFQEFGDKQSFAARYFNQSVEHQNLHRTIEQQATTAREAKREEIRQKKAHYKNLMQLHDNSECQFYEVVIDSINGFREKRHRDSDCKKCDYAYQAKNLRIRIHEWPLPTDEWAAKSTVFELKVPSFFGNWRDATMFLILDALKNEYTSEESPRSTHPLRSYRGLSSFFAPFNSAQRIGLLSENKPHEVTHRRDKLMSLTTESDVCLANGLLYQYFDDQNRCFVRDYHLTDELPNSCTFKLPAQSASLQPFLFRPSANSNGPSPNTVIARQVNCPDHLSLEEFKALTAIPLGYRLQWSNILLQLSVPAIDFKKTETGLVILQSIYQAGPPITGNILRAGHAVVEDENFAHGLLGALVEALKRVKENWESSQALNTFISLASRLLSLTTSEQIKTKSLAYLADVRVVAFDWVHLLREKAQQATNDAQRIDLSSKAVEIALICVNSFSLDEDCLTDILSIPKAASLLLQCSIIIQEGNYAISKSSNPMVSILHRRLKILSHRCYPILLRQVLQKEIRFLDDAIKMSWSAFQAGYGWRPVSAQVDHWLVGQAAPQASTDSDVLWVHFNLLTSELLVNGLPLARLPANYEGHLAYRTLFGNSALEVMPTTVAGMRFSGKKEYAGYTLYFGMNDAFNPVTCLAENDLLIQATKGDQQYELIPSRLFRGQFPEAFVDGFVHWYDKSDGSLEFRPLEDPWTSSTNNLRLSRAGADDNWRLQKDGISIVSFTSETAKVLAGILSPLENPLRIHIMLHHTSSRLEIELPKLQLGFNLKSGASMIQSRQFRGMSIDPDQSLGSLIGFRNKFILKHETNGRRLLVLPEGDISYRSEGDHVHVSIDKESATKIHAYYLDDRLGRLIDNGSLQSKLYLCYLHALTSFCLPDPLLHRTGTEQALSILSSAAVRSFDRLRQENVDLLTRIAHLTPKRSYYPANERVMQTVNWSTGLNFLAQHGSLYKYVRSIFDQATRAKVFHPDVMLPKLDQELDLLERDCIRSSNLRVSGFGAEDHTINHDTIYSARDRDQNSARGFRAFVISSIVYQKRPAPHYPVTSDLTNHLWNFLSQNTFQVLGPGHQVPSSELKFDAGLLADSSEFIAKYWSSLHRILSQNIGLDQRFQLMIWLATLAFASNADMQIIQTLASFYVVPAMAQISAPLLDSFGLQKGAEVNKVTLHNSLQLTHLPLSRTPVARLPTKPKESSYDHQKRQQRELQAGQSAALNGLVNALMVKWPCENPSVPTGPSSVDFSTYLDVAKAIQIAKPLFKTWYDNLQFRRYLGQTGDAFGVLTAHQLEKQSFALTIPAGYPRRMRSFISTDDVFACSAPLVSSLSSENISGLLSSVSSTAEMNPLLTALIECLKNLAGSKYQKAYVKDLQESSSCLEDQAQEYFLQPGEDEVKVILNDHLKGCKEHAHKTYEAILSASTSGFGEEESSKLKNGPSAIAAGVNQWPRLSPIFFLQQLARGRWEKITKDWKRCIVEYGLALSNLHRAERLLSLYGKNVELIKELQNPGHANWDPFEFPESLLLEIESGITIRNVQEQIASQMRDPPTGKNAVMQLNMGEGKSSVIVPIVAVTLADRSALVRVIVAKPQSKQMFEMLVSKFGGLLDRRIYHMPFSRAVKLTEAQANTIESIYRECMANGGILLVQPEHILSFKLMCIECMITDRDAIGRSLLHTQHFFDTSSRDIVDESDENFSVKFELIYTMGMQRPIEFSPDRWSCIQQVLDLVKMFVPSIKKALPNSIDIHEANPGSFPRTRFLRPDAEQRILGQIAERICETGLDGFPIARQPEATRQAVLRYVTEPNLTADEIAQVENRGPGGFWADTTCSTLLLLRGLLAGGVLAFAFSQKRWKVNYGLDATRQPSTRLAVPYRAKDSPTPRSEFSHPDVVIVLTSLSYYYGGLTNNDLFLAFSHLSKSDQADIEYQLWVKDAPRLQDAFRTLVGINLKDRVQCEQKVFPPLRYAKGAVDYFLAHIVFPKEMKEFPHKLSTSGWDIGAIKTHPTTGFSGTNDSRTVLPLSVEHLDLQEQKHTNALVLGYLLGRENSIALLPQREGASGSDADLLLSIVTNMEVPIQVILDVGAQILELSNLDVARKWLESVSNHDETQAAVFFNESDELSVVDRKGNIEPLQTSSFAKHLDVCLVFLDEAHTRGTDLRLPDNYRAAVTLGPNLTKDRLVQACMRMRKLGKGAKGQSVVFCVPEEIKNKILERASKSDHTCITVSNVLSWAISETDIDIRRSMSLWAAQGQRFEQQSKLWAEACNKEGFILSKTHAEKFLEEESRSLEDRYRPSSDTNVMQAGQNKISDLIAERCREFNDLKFNAATLQEEQERELSPEIEQERQVQKPASAEPALHQLHPDLITFVTEGVRIAGSKAYTPAFEILRNTSAAAHLDVSHFPQDLLVTGDFGRTVRISGPSYISDAYQRPVQWVLTSVSGGTNNTVTSMMIISPYEAQELLPKISKSKTVALHLYSPRPNLGFRAMDGLDLYTIPAQPDSRIIPRHLVVQLNLFAGQLYLSSFEEYVELCELLGLAWKTTEEGWVVAADGFIVQRGEDREETSKSTFERSPVKFLRVLMTKIRRNCDGIDKTHMGKILDGRLLRPADFGEEEEGI